MASIPFFNGDRVRLLNGRGVFKTSNYLTSLLHLHISSTTNWRITATHLAVYNKNYISEFEDIITAYESLLSILPIFSPLQGRVTLTPKLRPDHPSHHWNRGLGMRLPETALGSGIVRRTRGPADT